jgi:radical SAM protein with 4Fe4S-binding SPASM domain
LPSHCLGCEHSFRCDGGCREAAHIVGGQLESLDPLLVV